MKRVLIITPGGLPVPSVKGGAVQNLIEHFIVQNECEQKVNLFVIGPYDQEAEKFALQHYNNTIFVWKRIPRLVETIDMLLYKTVKALFPKVKAVSFRNNFRVLYYAFVTGRYIKRMSFDYIVIENNVRDFWAIRLFGNSRKYQGKVVYHLHNIPRSSGGNRRIIAQCNHYMCVSQFVKKTICSELSRIGVCDEKNTSVVYNCIDLDAFSPTNNQSETLRLKKQYGIDAEERVILFAGRLSWEKGVLEVIQAFSRVSGKVKLLIVGADFYRMKTSSTYERTVQKAAEEIKDRVVFTGYIDYHEMPKIYRMADIAVLPSMWDEPAGLTMIEAMACGVPTITTRSGGIPEYVSKAAIVLERDNMLVDNIAINIQELLNDAKKHVSYSKAGILQAREFTSKRYYEHFLKCISEDL